MNFNVMKISVLSVIAVLLGGPYRYRVRLFLRKLGSKRYFRKPGKRINWFLWIVIPVGADLVRRC
jgi:hypothetical protein